MVVLIGTLSFLIVMMGLFHLVARRFSSRLSSGGRKRWLVIHIVCVLVYFSGVSGLALTYALSRGTPFEGTDMYLRLLHMFDYVFIIPGGMGTFLSGAWLCVRTSLGLTRLRWIIAKWVGTLVIVATGIMCIGNTLDERIPALRAQGVIPGDPAWDNINFLLMFGMTLGLILMLILVVLSYLKPKNRKA